MNKDRDRIIFRRDDGSRANKRNDSDKSSSVHGTQGDATNVVREMLRNQGGSELTIKGRIGHIRSKDTIASGHDPFPLRDREHYIRDVARLRFIGRREAKLPQFIPAWSMKIPEFPLHLC